MPNSIGKDLAVEVRSQSSLHWIGRLEDAYKFAPLDPVWSHLEAVLVSTSRTGRTRLTLPLDSRSYTIQHDSHVKCPRVLPSMCDFGAQSVSISIVQL